MLNPDDYKVSNLFNNHVCKKCGHDLSQAVLLFGNEILSFHADLHARNAVVEELQRLHTRWNMLVSEELNIGICISDLEESFPSVFRK